MGEPRNLSSDDLTRCDVYGCDKPTGTDPDYFEFCRRHEYMHLVFRSGAHRRSGLRKRERTYG